MLVVLLWVSAVWLTLGALLTVGSIGKPKEPTTHGVAVFTVVVCAVIVSVMVSAAFALS